MELPHAIDPPAGALDVAAMRLPSLNFLLILLVFSGTGAAMWHGVVDGRLPIVVFVVSGWIVSLCLHEFGHALTAYLGGDRQIAETGYLDLDPLRYTDPALSIILPIVYVLLGGIGLPGGAVYINTAALRSRAWASAVAAAGPCANILTLAVLAVLVGLAPTGDPAYRDVAAGLAILAYFQATAIILNLLPLPGLDGFGIIRPYLPLHAAIRANEIGASAFLVLFLLIWLTPVGGFLSRAAVEVALAFGFQLPDISRGWLAMKLLSLR